MDAGCKYQKTFNVETEICPRSSKVLCKRVKKLSSINPLYTAKKALNRFLDNDDEDEAYYAVFQHALE